MEQHFSLAEAARRYDAYRPKVHDIILTWIEKHCPNARFENGIDIACGTGDSALPLRSICKNVCGIDSSPEMLKYAAAKNLNVTLGSYETMGPDRHYDFLSTGMAFHWFDPDKAVRAYKRISTDSAVWLIYTFSFAGHGTSEEFNDWLRTKYAKEYPNPPRNRTSAVIPEDDERISLLGKGSGYVPVVFDHDRLVGYLSTQSNIETAVKNGKSYETVCDDLLHQVAAIDISGNFKYNYSYEIHRLV